MLLPLAGKGARGPVDRRGRVCCPRNAETTRALDRMRAAFPGSDAPVAVVVYARDTGITAADRAAVEADRAAFAGLAPAPVRPSTATTGRPSWWRFPVPGHGRGGGCHGQARSGRQVADSPAGLRTAVTGSAGVEADGDEVGSGVETTLLLATVGVVAVLLLVTYRSPVLWLVPLVAVGLASQVAAGRGVPAVPPRRRHGRPRTAARSC